MEIAGICFYPAAFGRLVITTADISGVNNNKQTDKWLEDNITEDSGALPANMRAAFSGNRHEMV